jgi:hypothetical protein
MLIRPLLLSTALAASLLAAGCSTPPADLDLSLSKPSASGTYRVTLEPPAPMPAINQMHSWKVKLATADGAAVSGATFKVGGGMPQHGHGFPTQPRVTRELEPGTYLMEGMKFSMTGWWDVKLAIAAKPGADDVTFNAVIGDMKK